MNFPVEIDDYYPDEIVVDCIRELIQDCGVNYALRALKTPTLTSDKDQKRRVLETLLADGTLHVCPHICGRLAGEPIDSCPCQQAA
jgi:hypothetical protein